MAVKQVQLRRAQMFAAMVSQGGADAHLSSKSQSDSTQPLWFKAKGKAESKAEARKHVDLHHLDKCAGT